MKWISDLIDIIFPRSCAVCGKALSSGEKDICINCLIDLPRLPSYTPANNIEKLFYGILPIERATAYIHYAKESPVEIQYQTETGEQDGVRSDLQQ